MKLSRLLVPLFVFGCFAQGTTENTGITRLYLFGDPIGLVPVRTGVQDISGGLLHWNGDSCNCSHLLRTFELRFFHWYFDEYQKDYSLFMADEARAPGGFNAWGAQLAVERVIPFSLFHWPFFPAFYQQVYQQASRPNIGGWVFGVGGGITVYTPAGARARDFSPDWFWNGSPFIGVQVVLRHFLLGVRGGYAHEEEFSYNQGFMTFTRDKFFGSMVIGGIFYHDLQKK